MLQFRLKTMLLAMVVWAAFLAAVRLFGALGSAAFFVIVIVLATRLRDGVLRKAVGLFSTGGLITSLGADGTRMGAVAWIGVLITLLGIIALLMVWSDSP